MTGIIIFLVENVTDKGAGIKKSVEGRSRLYDLGRTMRRVLTGGKYWGNRPFRIDICLLLAVSSAWLMGSTVRAGGDEASSGNSTNHPVESLVLRSLTGEYVFLRNFCYSGPERPRRTRSAVVLNFVATDCAPCRREMPEFLEITAKHKNSNVRFFLVATDPLGSEKQIQEFMREFNVSHPVLLDPYQIACGKLGIEGIPRTVVVSPEGSIVASLGFKTGYGKLLRKAIDKALKEDGGGRK